MAGRGGNKLYPDLDSFSSYDTFEQQYPLPGVSDYLAMMNDTVSSKLASSPVTIFNPEVKKSGRTSNQT